MKLYKDLSSAGKVRQEVRALKLSIKTDEVPAELFTFPYLEELYLEGNVERLILPPGSWEHLTLLSLKWPAFRGDLSSLFGLPRLHNLKIIETPLKNLLLPLGHARAPLQSLTLKDCGLKELPEEFSLLTDLKELNLSGNRLTTLPQGMRDLRFLKRLNLDQNQLQTFPSVIKHMPYLAHLSLDTNPFSDEEKARIEREFHLWIK